MGDRNNCLWRVFIRPASMRLMKQEGKVDEDDKRWEGRYRWKAGNEREKKKRLLHYRDQLLGTVSYGICCTKCHVALLHWDSVWRKSEIINHTERKRRGRQRKPRENQKQHRNE